MNFVICLNLNGLLIQVKNRVIKHRPKIIIRIDGNHKAVELFRRQCHVHTYSVKPYLLEQTRVMSITRTTFNGIAKMRGSLRSRPPNAISL